MDLSTYLCICVYLCVSVHICACLYVSVYCVSSYLSICLSVHLRLYVCVSRSLGIYWCIMMYLFPQELEVSRENDQLWCPFVPHPIFEQSPRRIPKVPQPSFLHTLCEGLQHLGILEQNGEETFVPVDGVEAFKPALELIAWAGHGMRNNIPNWWQ